MIRHIRAFLGGPSIFQLNINRSIVSLVYLLKKVMFFSIKESMTRCFLPNSGGHGHCKNSGYYVFILQRTKIPTYEPLVAILIDSGTVLLAQKLC